MNMTLSCTRKETREKERQEDQTSGPEEIWRSPIREGEDRYLVPDKGPGMRVFLGESDTLVGEHSSTCKNRWFY